MVTNHENKNCDGGGIMGVIGGIKVDPLNSVPGEIKSSGNTLKIIGYDEKLSIEPIERTVSAEKQFIFSLHRTDVKLPVVNTCDISLSFYPSPGGEYEVVYAENTSHCGAQVFKLTLNNSLVIRTKEVSVEKLQKTCKIK